jgi:hypothetical protein
MGESIVFNTIAANVIEQNAGIFIGQNSANNWVSHNKIQGSILGVVGFNNSLPHNINILNDNDVYDTCINDNDYYGPSPTTQT